MDDIQNLEIKDLIDLLRAKHIGREDISLEKLVLAGDTDSDYQAILAEIVKKLIKGEQISDEEELRN